MHHVIGTKDNVSEFWSKGLLALQIPPEFNFRRNNQKDAFGYLHHILQIHIKNIRTVIASLTNKPDDSEEKIDITYVQNTLADFTQLTQLSAQIARFLRLGDRYEFKEKLIVSIQQTNEYIREQLSSLYDHEHSAAFFQLARATICASMSLSEETLDSLPEEVLRELNPDLFRKIIEYGGLTIEEKKCFKLFHERRGCFYSYVGSEGIQRFYPEYSFDPQIKSEGRRIMVSLNGKDLSLQCLFEYCVRGVILFDDLLQNLEKDTPDFLNPDGLPYLFQDRSEEQLFNEYETLPHRSKTQYYYWLAGNSHPTLAGKLSQDELDRLTNPVLREAFL